MPTMIDVAREARVGIMSVSRVINNHPSVKESTRAKVLRAIARTGYQPNDAARILKGRAARAIALAVPDLSDFYASCFHAVQSVASQHDYQTLVIATGKSASVEQQQLDALVPQRAAGLVLVTAGAPRDCLQRLVQRGVPIVALDRPLEGLTTDAVLVENRNGAAEGVTHLVAHGHKRIACVGFDTGSHTVGERIKGYKKALRGAGLEPMLYTHVRTQDEMNALVAQWKCTAKHPSAVFSLKRISTVQLVQALHQQKMRVPQDLAVVGFDDFELAEVLGTPLTVVRQSPADLARAAAELLFKRIQSGQEAPAAKMLFPAELVIRRSCGCPGE